MWDNTLLVMTTDNGGPTYWVQKPNVSDTWMPNFSPMAAGVPMVVVHQTGHLEDQKCRIGRGEQEVHRSLPVV